MSTTTEDPDGGTAEPATETAASANQQPDEARSAWVFYDQPPTVDQVRELLLRVPDSYGVRYIDFIDYVQALPQELRTKGKLTNEQGRRDPETVRDTWALYFSVAGRIAMLNAAAALNDWETDLVPEQHTGDNPVGFIQYNEKLVYREYCVITQRTGKLIEIGEHAGTEWLRPMGRKSGTAWAPASGGRAAEKSNPYEVVETSARGRAIGAWGIGVIPGSGVASLEEMRQVSRNEAANSRGNAAAESTPKIDREEILTAVQSLSEEARQAMGFEEGPWLAKVAEYLVGIGVRFPLDPETGKVVWSTVKDGQLLLTGNKFRELMQQHAADQPL